PKETPPERKQPEVTVHPIRVQPIIRRVPQGTATGSGSRQNPPRRGDRPQGDRDSRGDRESRGDRDSRGDRGDQRPRDQWNNDRRPYDNRNQGDKKPAGQAGQGRPQQGSSASAQPAGTQRRDSGRDKDSAKTEKRNEGTRRTAGPQKAGKYNDARNWIGSKGSVSDVESDEFSINDNYVEKNRQGLKNPKQKKKNQIDEQARIQAQKLTNVKIPPTITVGAFASLIKKTVSEVIMKLFKEGIMASQNQEIDFDTAAIIADSYGITAEPEIIVSNEELLLEDPEDKEPVEDAEPRPPVVVVMGHVDHGKTSLLDAIRNTSVTAGEAGGITQHIGAYTVTINDHKITFLDTPGHEAFTAMRARGAQVTDVAIIVVAADDGVMPQTIEAINHAKAANVSVVVAVNKIDKEGANIDRVKNEMAEQGIVCEDWGGDVPFVPVSAKKGINIDELLETVILSADILELKASRTKQCKGTVIEAKLDKNKGPVATLLVQRGTLRTGDAILTETTFGHVRRMTDDKGRTIKEAGPSMPVEVTGLPEVPEAGKVFYCVNKDEHLAKKVADERIAKNRERTMTYSNKVTLEDLYSQIKAGEVKNLDIIVKADVKGSVEAVKSSLESISNDEVRVRVIHSAVGGVNESDVLLAEASNAVIIGFNVRPIGNVGEMAIEKHVDVKLYKVIYDAIEDVKAAMKGMLKPEFKEVVTGHVEIRKTFKVSGVGTVAGGYVLNGKVQRNSDVRIVRDGIVVYEGKLASLKRFQDDVKEVASGYECGLSFESYNDIKEGDVAECYVMEQVERNL
ncbi:MAG: translation initiation factor IF-2, partial [Clostridia bacterium]|nr:translation initiation factor IF-2 [Clostridia bacterium]